MNTTAESEGRGVLPLVSIVVPAYNEAQNLSRFLASPWKVLGAPGSRQRLVIRAVGAVTARPSEVGTCCLEQRPGAWGARSWVRCRGQAA